MMGGILASVIVTFTLVALSSYAFSTANPEFASICCDWDRESRVNLMPHPTQCSVFYQCRPMQSSDGSIYLAPILRYCPKDEGGNPMYFDFPTCMCVRGYEVTCYNDGNPEHYLGFYNCSDKFYEGGRTLPCF